MYDEMVLEISTINATFYGYIDFVIGNNYFGITIGTYSNNIILL